MTRSCIAPPPPSPSAWLLVLGSVWGLLAQPLPLAAGAEKPEAASRPRVIVLTDITNEPDDQESLVRFLVYANEYDIEGLIATTSTWLRDRTSPENLRECVAAYGRVRNRLARHAEGYPTAEALAAVIRTGRPEFGMRGVGEERDSPGSQLIFEALDRDDPRPLWVCAWGGPNCLAQALWRLRRERPKEEVDRLVSKLRVYAIADQDDSGPWMRREFPGLCYIVSPSGELSSEYHRGTWTGISGDEYYLNGPGWRLDLVSNEWLQEHIRTGHGPLGELYPPWEYIMEGDTPSFLNLINNGLGSHVDPGYGGWGGRYALKQPASESRPIWTDSRDAVQLPGGARHVSNQATIWRWREAFQHDFAARMDWCVAQSRDAANHPPLAVLDGDETKQVLRRQVRRGETVTLSAAGTRDDDGNQVRFRWFHYPEANRDLPNVRALWEVPLTGAASEEVRFTVPQELPRGTREIHLILDVSDDGQPSLHAYRRMILEVTE